MAPSKRGRKISHCAFFKIGVFEGEHLVCCVKSATTLSSQSDIKIYKPETMPNNKKKTGLARMLAGTHEVLKPSKVSLVRHQRVFDRLMIYDRNSTYLVKFTPYISFGPHCALVVPTVSILSQWLHYRLNLFSTKPTLLWTLSLAKRISSPSMLNVSTRSFCCAFPIFLSLSIVMAGVLSMIGRLPGKALPKVSLSFNHTYWRLSPASLR